MKLNQAIQTATQFLLAARDRQGWWHDFRLAPGQSDEWVTAYVGTALAGLATRPAAMIALQAWRLLAGRRSTSPGWGYNAWPPPDADSTLWALQLARATGCADWRQARQGQEFLARHLQPGGGLTTYAADSTIRQFTGASAGSSFAGWCGPQVCVTAAAAALPSFQAAACRFLRQTQAEDGHWPSYWWSEDEYATTLAAEALARSGTPDDQARVQRAVAWALGRIRDDGAVISTVRPCGSSFATAWIIRLLRLGGGWPGVSEALSRAVDWLLGQQLAHGAWPASAGLRVPPPDVTCPEQYKGWIMGGFIEGGVSLDQHGIFTTATALQALNGVFKVELPRFDLSDKAVI